MLEGPLPCTSFVLGSLTMMNYIIAKLLLVSCMSAHNHVLYFARAGSMVSQNNKQKQTTKNFAKFSNQFPLPY